MNNMTHSELEKFATERIGSGWRAIAVQGGDLNQRRNRSGEYLLSGMWVDTGGKWYEISTDRRENDNHAVAIRVCDVPPVPEPSKFNRPPRALVDHFPTDLPLDSFLSSHPIVISFPGCWLEDQALLSYQSLVLRSSQGVSVSITASARIVGDIALRLISG